VMAAGEVFVELGRIGAPFGVQGWVKVSSFTDPPDELLRFRRWTLRLPEQARVEHRLLQGHWQGRGLVARLEGVEGRNAAERLRGASVEVPRGKLPPPGERQFYRADLIGLPVKNLEGLRLGVVEYFVDTPVQAVMVVRGEREHWVPATPRHLRRVDLASGLIEVDWPLGLE
jgi:16S rRNA processing protein RimM